MADPNGHETGNGGYNQGIPNVIVKNFSVDKRSSEETQIRKFFKSYDKFYYQVYSILFFNLLDFLPFDSSYPKISIGYLVSLLHINKCQLS
jgi:hypothetical protein